MMKKVLFFFFFIVLHHGLVFSQVNMIPKPLHSKENPQFFPMHSGVVITYTNDSCISEANVFNAFLKKTCGYSLRLQKSDIAPLRNAIHLEYISDSSEAYTLSVDAYGIKISGGKSGIFYGLMTIWQGLRKNEGSQWMIDGAEIMDRPVYSWRGMHLDCSRHFFNVEEIKKFLDYLAMYKLNKFHWHLTDDQGWRVEIKQFPLLTAVGSVRKETMLEKNFNPYQGDGIPVKGFYTQMQVKEIVQYARDRHIEVIPEIEMPGHSTAAVSAYPFLSCSQKKTEVMTKWGVSAEVFCTRDTVLHFLYKVLDEVADLFPSSYLHIGGDEVDKTAWKSCIHCQNVMQKSNLKTEEELQSYIISSVNNHLKSKGKKLIGWDEIMEGGLADSVVVMAWRSTKAGIEAARLGADVVFCPNDYFYFDHYQGLPDIEPLAIGGMTRLEKVYAYSFPLDSLTTEQKSRVLGAQANVWTEYIRDFASVEYMMMPRMAALSELVWTPDSLREFTSFANRLVQHMKILDVWKINYSKAGFTPQYKSFSNPNGAGISLRTELPVDYMTYSLDGTDLTAGSNSYTDSFYIVEEGVLKASSYVNGEKMGKTLQRTLSYSYSTNKLISLEATPDLPDPSTGITDQEYAKMLVNGISGGVKYNKYDYVGYKGKDLRATIDLGDMRDINGVEFSFYQDTSNAIYYPVMIQVELSVDKQSWSNPYTLNQGAIEKGKGHVRFALLPKRIRYVRILIKNRTNLPPWHAQAGKKVWLLTSEIGVK